MHRSMRKASGAARRHHKKSRPGRLHALIAKTHPQLAGEITPILLAEKPDFVLEHWIYQDAHLTEKPHMAKRVPERYDVAVAEVAARVLEQFEHHAKAVAAASHLTMSGHTFQSQVQLWLKRGAASSSLAIPTGNPATTTENWGKTRHTKANHAGWIALCPEDASVRKEREDTAVRAREDKVALDRKYAKIAQQAARATFSEAEKAYLEADKASRARKAKVDAGGDRRPVPPGGGGRSR